jgi:hypothetical protein
MSTLKKSLLAAMAGMIFLLGACEQVTSTPANIMPMATLTLTPIPSAMLIPSETPTLSPLQKAHITEKCLEVAPAKPQVTNSAGVVVLLKNSQDIDIVREAVLLDLETDQMTELPRSGKEHFSYYSVSASPDRRALVYGVVVPETTECLIIYFIFSIC